MTKHAIPDAVLKGHTAERSCRRWPLHLRPRAALTRYHIRWQAECARIPPKDPYLLRRIRADMWLVCAMWDLTDVERAALATRVGNA
jgi:hypothetical protein